MRVTLKSRRRASVALAVIGSLFPTFQVGPSALAQSPQQQEETTVVVSPGCGDDGILRSCGGKIVTSVSEAASDANELVVSVTAPLTGADPSRRHVPYDRIVTGPDGQWCTTTGWREVTDSSVPDGVYQIPDADLGNILATYPPCPEERRESSASLTPAQVAVEYWETIPLPAPKPYIAPGWGITGKIAYLETNGTLHDVYTNDTPFGPLSIIATGTYHVDWGDGETTGPYSVEGNPWPQGEITHEYIWSGTYDIMVTIRWKGSWQLAGASGVLRELRTTGQIDDFRVRQIQAVIR